MSLGDQSILVLFLYAGLFQFALLGMVGLWLRNETDKLRRINKAQREAIHLLKLRKRW